MQNGSPDTKQDGKVKCLQLDSKLFFCQMYEVHWIFVGFSCWMLALWATTLDEWKSNEKIHEDTIITFLQGTCDALNQP